MGLDVNQVPESADGSDDNVSGSSTPPAPTASHVLAELSTGPTKIKTTAIEELRRTIAEIASRAHEEDRKRAAQQALLAQLLQQHSGDELLRRLQEHGLTHLLGHQHVVRQVR